MIQRSIGPATSQFGVAITVSASAGYSHVAVAAVESHASASGTNRRSVWVVVPWRYTIASVPLRSASWSTLGSIRASIASAANARNGSDGVASWATASVPAAPRLPHSRTALAHACVAAQVGNGPQSASAAHLPAAVTQNLFWASHVCHDAQSFFAVTVSQRPGADTQTCDRHTCHEPGQSESQAHSVGSRTQTWSVHVCHAAQSPFATHSPAESTHTFPWHVPHETQSWSTAQLAPRSVPASTPHSPSAPQRSPAWQSPSPVQRPPGSSLHARANARARKGASQRERVMPTSQNRPDTPTC